VDGTSSESRLGISGDRAEVSVTTAQVCFLVYLEQPVSIAEQSEASTVFDRSDVEIAGSNPALSMDVCLRFSVLCCPV
jgi:hypothetical protein